MVGIVGIANLFVLIIAVNGFNVLS